MGETAFLVMAICSMQSGNGSACNAAARAYFTQIQGQKVLDQVNKDYLDHLPNEIKQIGAAGGLYYRQKLRIMLHHGLYFSIEYQRMPDLTEEFQTTSLKYELTFP
jgi:hypothetical protein